MDYGIAGLEVHRSHTKEGTMRFVTAHQEVVFPEHSHAEQWTVELKGTCSYTANGVTTVYKKALPIRLQQSRSIRSPCIRVMPKGIMWMIPLMVTRSAPEVVLMAHSEACCLNRRSALLPFKVEP
ncbi:MAG: hypothetical protein K6F05_04945 [Succinivibrio sp.]|nr:hypothetical protein [Succinivibrio sp.]